MTFEELQDLLAEQFSCDSGELERGVSLAEIASASQFGHMVPLEVTETHTSPLSPPPYMVGAAEIELDKEN